MMPLSAKTTAKPTQQDGEQAGIALADRLVDDQLEEERHDQRGHLEQQRQEQHLDERRRDNCRAGSTGR